MEEYIKQGEALFHEGKIDEAESHFSKLLEQYPEHAEILNNMGVIQHVRGDIKKAEAYFLRAHAAQIDHIDALLNLADLYENQKQWKDAAYQLEKCVLIHASDPDLFNRFAMACLESGNIEGARNALIKSLELKSEQEDILEILTTLDKKFCPGSNDGTRSSLVVNKGYSNGWLNILVRGGGFINKGAEAMVRTVQREMTTRLPHVRFYMEVPHHMAEFIESKGLSPVIANSSARYAKLDGVIDVSGFALGDAWGVRNSQYYHYHNSIFESFGKPVVFLPQAWGPFTNQSMRQLSAAAINLSNCAYARDKRSYQYMTELEGVDRQKIGIAPDIAYQFEGASEANALHVLMENGIALKEKKNTIGIMPNMQVYLRTEGKGTENKYVKLLIDLVKYFLSKRNFSIILIPHQVQPIENPDTPDDRFLCDLITAALGNVPDVAFLRGYYSAEILKAVIGQMDLIVGSRYHGIIAALSQMIPAVVLGWSHKYFELLRDVGIEQYIADYKNSNRDDFFALVEHAWINRKEVTGTLKQSVPEQVQKSAVALTHAASIFANRYLS